MTAPPPIVKPETPPRALAVDLTARGNAEDAPFGTATGGTALQDRIALADAREMLRSLGDALDGLRTRAEDPTRAPHVDLVSLTQVDLPGAIAAAGGGPAIRTPPPRSDLDAPRREPRPDAAHHARPHENADASIPGSAASADTSSESASAPANASAAGGDRGGASSSTDGSTSRGGAEGGERGDRAETPVLLVHAGGGTGLRTGATAAAAAPASSAIHRASELVERIVSQARELRETAGGREVSFEVQGEADQRIRVRLAIHEDRSLRVSFDTGDQGVVHALRERVEILRGRLQECGFDATEVSFRGWDTSAGTSAGTGEMRSDRGDEHGTAPREEDDLAQVVPGAARANGPRPAMGEAEATRTRPGDGRLSWVA